MNHSISYMQYREHKPLRYKSAHYLPSIILTFFIAVVWVAADRLHIDWNRLWFKEINHVRIEGEYKYIDRFEIEQLLSPFLGNTVGRAEMDSIEKMLKDLPWVKHVLIERSWSDDTLVINLEEREVVAYWGGHALLDADAEVFTPRLMGNDNLPILDAVAGREKDILHFYYRLNDWLALAGLQVIYLQEDPSRAYTVQLENAPRLILGRHLFESRIKRFIAAYHAGFVDYMHHAACIDLRYLDGYAVRWKRDGGSQSC